VRTRSAAIRDTLSTGLQTSVRCRTKIDRPHQCAINVVPQGIRLRSTWNVRKFSEINDTDRLNQKQHTTRPLGE
jgi:hypothetical protein